MWWVAELLLLLLGGVPGMNEKECVPTSAPALLALALDAAGGEAILLRVHTEELECSGVFRSAEGDRRYTSRIRTRLPASNRIDMAGGTLPGALRVVITATEAFATMDELPTKPPEADFVARTRAAPRAATILNLLTRSRRGDRARAWKDCRFLSRAADTLELCEGTLCEKYYLDPTTHALLGVEDDRTTVRLLDLRPVAGVGLPHRWQSFPKGADFTGDKTCRWKLNGALDPKLFARTGP